MPPSFLWASVASNLRVPRNHSWPGPSTCLCPLSRDGQSYRRANETQPSYHSAGLSQLVETSHPPTFSHTHTDPCRVPTSPSLDAFSNGEDGLALGSGLHRQPLSVSSSTGTLASGLGDSGRLCGPGSVRPSRSSDKSPVGDTVRSLVTRSYWSPEDHRLLACSDG